MNRRTFLKLSVFTGAGALISSYPIFIERYLFQINNYRIPLTNLPQAFEGFRIVHLTDLHLGLLVPELVIESVIAKANALNSDIIVCTGDYVHARRTAEEIDRVWPIVQKLRAHHGVYSVLGNHDHWADTKRSLEWLSRSGQGIRHKSVAIEKSDARIWLGGAGDLWTDELGIDEAFKGCPADECKILLSHNPDSADEGFATNVDLIISGHTHGGQVRLPFIGAPVLPVKNRNYSSGFISGRKTNLFISKGIGWAILPVRFNCPPEIAILNLTRAEKHTHGATEAATTPNKGQKSQSKYLSANGSQKIS